MNVNQNHRQQYKGGGKGHGNRQSTSAPAYFDPGTPQAQLVNERAERQANALEISSSQLRKFFGEVKDLFRRLQAGQDYAGSIEPQFKMLRSKAYYATRSGGGQQRISPQFCQFIENAVQKVKTEDHFRLFVAHFEAVVGFMYGLNKVK